MSERSTLLDTLVRLHRQQRSRRTRRYLRFRLRSLLILITVVAAICASYSIWGTAAVNHAKARLAYMYNGLPTTAVADVVVFPCTLVGIMTAAAVIGVVSRFDSRHGYLAFAILSCVSLLLLLAALGLDTESLARTQLRHLQLSQIVRIGLVLISCVVPPSAFLGWYFSSSAERHS